MASITRWLRSPNARLPLAIVLFGAATVCLLWIGIFGWARQEERDTLAQMQRDTANLVIAFSEDVLRTITAIDQVTVVVKADYERDPDHFRLPDWIDKSPALLGTTAKIAIIGADGRRRMSNIAPADDRVDLSDREHFRYHLSPTAPQPYISVPVRGRVSGELSIKVTRRLERSDHSFAGVLVASLDPSYLSRFFDSVDLGGQGVVLLLGRDGIVRARRTRTPEVEPDNLVNTLLFKELSKGTDHGSYRARSPIDGVERVKSFAALPGYPLAVMVGLGVDEGMRHAQEELRVNVLQGAIVSLVIAGLVALLVRQVARREETEAQLRQAQKMESIGRLTGGVAHDFNNMLTAIAGNVERVLRRERDPEKVRNLTNIEHTVSHGARLVHHLLAFARRQHLKPEPLDVNRLVESFVEILKTTCGPTILIEVELRRDLWLAMADGNQVETAILNVALNARDAMPDGGRIAIETANVGAGDPRPRDLPPGDFVAITMRDTGTGMTGEVLAKAFDPFFTTKEFGRGSGLGLSQVYGMAKQSGGTVELDSAPGQGTAVRIYLPRARAHEPLSFKAGEARSRGAATILVVDDDSLVRECVTASLAEAGYSVLEAADGHAALRTLDQEAVDLALIDLRMPDMPGTEVARRARLLREHLPILFLTGYADPELTRMVGDDPLLEKPFMPEVLEAKVANILQGTRSGSVRKFDYR